MDIPGYWMKQTSGALGPVIEDYLNDRPLTEQQIETMRLYLRQFIAYEGWRGVEHLRHDVGLIRTQEDIHRWLDKALLCGLDPL